MSIQNIFEQQHHFFLTNQTKDTDFRIAQLRQLIKILKAHEQEMYDAIYKDFGKANQSKTIKIVKLEKSKGESIVEKISM